MNQFTRILCGIATALAFMTSALAQGAGTRDEAKALAEAAMTHVKKVGPDQAFKDFSTDKATWTKKDLYVMAYDKQGTCVGHGANEKLIGKNLIELKDPNGKLLVKEMTETAMQKNSGWVDYDWTHPITKKVEGKSTYVRKLANFEGWVGVGVYR